MASDGTRVFVLGGYSKGAGADEISLVHAFDTSTHFSFCRLIWTATKTENTEQIKYPEYELNAVSSNDKTSQLACLSSAGPSTKEQPQHPKSSSWEDDVNEGSTKYHAKFAAPHSSFEGDAARLEHERFMGLKRQLLVSLAAQTERDQRIAQLTDELALKSSLLEQAEANAVETAKRAGLEPREHVDRPVMQISMVKQSDLMDKQAKPEESPLSRDQQYGQYGKKLANVRAKLEAKETELEAIRLRLTDTEKGWNESKAEADTLRTQISTDEDRVVRRLTERMRAMIEAEMSSLRRKEESRESI